MKERGDSLLEQTQKMCQIVLKHVHESETFNVGDKTLRERTERPVIDHDDLSHEKIMVNTRRTWTSEFQGYHIPL